jgi:hypothetical protein
MKNFNNIVFYFSWGEEQNIYGQIAKKYWWIINLQFFTTQIVFSLHVYIIEIEIFRETICLDTKLIQKNKLKKLWTLLRKMVEMFSEDERNSQSYTYIDGG